MKVTPDQRVFRGETVTLTCDIQGAGHIQWRYSWFKDGHTPYPFTTTTAAEYRFRADYESYSGEYSCRGEGSYLQSSDISDAVTLTVSGEYSYSIQFKFICIALFTIQSLQSALQEIKFLQYIYTL